MIIVNVDAGVDEVEEEKLNAARKETNDQLDVVVDGGQEDDGMTASQVGYDLLRGILDGHDVEQSGKPEHFSRKRRKWLMGSLLCSTNRYIIFANNTERF